MFLCVFFFFVFFCFFCFSFLGGSCIIMGKAWGRLGGKVHRSGGGGGGGGGGGSFPCTPPPPPPPWINLCPALGWSFPKSQNSSYTWMELPKCWNNLNPALSCHLDGAFQKNSSCTWIECSEESPFVSKVNRTTNVHTYVLSNFLL